MQTRRAKRTRIGIESLEGRQLTTSIATEALSPPDAADVQEMADPVQAAQANQDVYSMNVNKASPKLF